MSFDEEEHSTKDGCLTSILMMIISTLMMIIVMKLAIKAVVG